jgi:hypothetical protein
VKEAPGEGYKGLGLVESKDEIERGLVGKRHRKEEEAPGEGCKG